MLRSLSVHLEVCRNAVRIMLEAAGRSRTLSPEIGSRTMSEVGATKTDIPRHLIRGRG